MKWATVMVLKVDVPAELMHGHADEGYGPVADAFRRNFTERGEIGAACAIYRDGRKVVDLWGGYRDGITRTPWRDDTMVVMFSTAKGVASLALAHAGGLLDYDERVAAYWPQFAWRGEGQITVHRLLSHQAGLPVMDMPLTAITGEFGLNAATLEALVRPAQLPSGGLVGGGLVDVLLKTPVVYSLGDTKPTAGLPFGSAANAAFAAPGNGGSFGISDPDTGIGYGYAPNRLGFGLIDQQLALRDTLDRDVLGERPQRPTQRLPPPEAPAGDLQPATPRRSDPEHPPLGAPLIHASDSSTERGF